MKIAMTITVDVSKEGWCEAQGWDPALHKAPEISADVKSYIETNLHGMALIEESGATITIR